MDDILLHRPDSDMLHSAPDLAVPALSCLDETASQEPETDASGSDNLLDLLSTHFLICNDKIRGKGEDSGLESYHIEAGIAGVFDGCGGLGSRACPSFSNMTEAYLAARTVGHAVQLWFQANSCSGYDWNADALKSLIVSNLSLCQDQSDGSGLKLKGSLIRPFPSTLALITFRYLGGRLLTEHIWAGDSRTYILDKDGLGQISRDDIKGEDAMSNLTKDSALTNVISADGKFSLHKFHFETDGPCMMMSASDGCFGYVSSPMEFEALILSCLMEAASVDEWQKLLNAAFTDCAGDDQTIALAVFGFDSFRNMQQYYAARFSAVNQIVKDFNNADTSGQQKIWQTYKPDYYRHTANGA